jgi:acetolactate synthase-1/2/3 large subunit
MKTVATLLIEHLKKYGVTHVFGIPGKAISPLVMEADKQGIKYVLCRHEAGAGFAATGFSLDSDLLGVAIGTSGPGGTNMLTAAAQAKAFNLPVLFITGQPSMKNVGRALVQDSSIFGTDLVKMFEQVTLFSARVERGDLFHLYFQHALEKAWCGRGPVHLSIPFDVLMDEPHPFELEFPIRTPVLSSEIDRIIPILDNAKYPVMLLGNGVHSSKAYEEVHQLAMRWQIPVMTTPSGKGCFPNDSPLLLGGLGVAGSKDSYNQLRHGVDLMLVIGTNLSDMALAGVTSDLLPKQVIQFDSDLTFIGKSIPVAPIAVMGDLKYNIQKILSKTTYHKAINQNSGIRQVVNSEEIGNFGKYISTAQTMRILRKNLPNETLIISDSGSHSFYAVKYLDIYKPGTFYFDDFFGAMGHAIGVAIGAKLSRPDCKVVCITGDGCLMMHGTEISTAVCNNVSAIFVVINNGRLDMVEKAMQCSFGNVIGAVYETPLDATLFGRSLGASAFCCHSESEIENALKIALQHHGPTVIEVMVDPDEIPPTLSRET